MDDIDAKTLRELSSWLTEKVGVEEHMPAFTSKNLFNTQQLQVIEAERTQFEKMKKVLEFLPRRGPKAFDKFCAIMNESDYDWVTEELKDKKAEIMARKNEGDLEDDDNEELVENGKYAAYKMTEKGIFNIAKELGTEEEITALAKALGFKQNKINGVFENKKSNALRANKLLVDWKNSVALKPQSVNMEKLKEALKEAGQPDLLELLKKEDKK